MREIDVELERRAHLRPTFVDCAARYLAQSCVTAVTIDRSLEVVRTILNRAARFVPR